MSVCGCRDCPFPPCPCGEDHGSCPGDLCRDCYHESIFRMIEENERANPGALEARLKELTALFKSKRRRK